MSEQIYGKFIKKVLLSLPEPPPHECILPSRSYIKEHRLDNGTMFKCCMYKDVYSHKDVCHKIYVWMGEHWWLASEKTIKEYENEV